MMPKSSKSLMTLIVILLFIPIVLLQKAIDPMRKQFEPDMHNVSEAGKALPIAFALGATTGFREAIAGLLWVRTDKFFHEGNYDAIIPMIRLITWLDPHNIEVYQTGAWHLDYNFTDEEQRSDRRYIPLSISLLEEGIANNPDVTKLYADLAFTHYFRKLENFQKSVEWYTKAQQLKETDSKQPLSLDPETGKYGHYVIDPITHEPSRLADPTIVGHGLAHALIAEGDIAGAIKQWEFCIADHQRLIQESPSTAPQDRSSMQVAIKNLKETEQREVFRRTDTKPPTDWNFDGYIVRTAPRRFRVVGSANVIGATSFILEGHKVTWGPVDGARINFRLEDADYVQPQTLPFNLKANLPSDVTIMQDSASITKGHFDRRVNMDTDSQGDHPMYPFKAEKYRFVMWFNPTSTAACPPNVQDRIGYVGEGLTDKNFLDTTGKVPGSLQGPNDVANIRMIKKVIYLTRDDIMGKGEASFH